MCWCVFAPSFFFCVPLFASWLSNFHLIFILISLVIPRSSSFSSHFLRAPPCRRQGVCVCVCTVWRDVKLPLIILYYIYGWGSPGSRGGRWSTKTPPRDLCKRTSGTVVVHLGAFKSQLVATIVPYIYIYIDLTNLICMSQDSVPAGSYNDPFLSSVCECVCVCKCGCMCVNICKRERESVCVCVSVCVYKCMSVCVSACIPL